MEAIRIFEKPRNRKLVINVPSEYDDYRMEIIIIPLLPEKKNLAQPPLEAIRRFRGTAKNKFMLREDEWYKQ